MCNDILYKRNRLLQAVEQKQAPVCLARCESSQFSGSRVLVGVHVFNNPFYMNMLHVSSTVFQDMEYTGVNFYFASNPVVVWRKALFCVGMTVFLGTNPVPQSVGLTSLVLRRSSGPTEA